MKQKILWSGLTLFFALFCFPVQNSAAATGNPADEFSWELIYKLNLLRANAPNSARHSGHGNLDLKIAVDGSKAFNIPDSGLLIQFMNNHGGKLNNHLDTAQGIDNIEAYPNTFLHQLWYQQHLAQDRLSLLVGLYDLNSEFYVTNSSSVFLLPTFGMGAEVAQTGKNGPSLFPVTSASVRIKWQPVPELYWQTALLDGVPGDPAHPRGTKIRLGKNDGLLQVSEIGLLPDASSGGTKLALGAWRYTSRFDDLFDTDAAGSPTPRRNKGFYVLAETLLWRGSGHPHRGLSGFVRVGRANQEINALEKSVNAGLVYRDLFTASDRFGIAVSAVRTGAKFRTSAGLAGERELESEITYEMTYQARINEHLSIQPVFQQVRSIDVRETKKINVVGIRLELAFGSN